MGIKLDNCKGITKAAKAPPHNSVECGCVWPESDTTGDTTFRTCMCGLTGADEAGVATGSGVQWKSCDRGNSPFPGGRGRPGLSAVNSAESAASRNSCALIACLAELPLNVIFAHCRSHNAICW
jgi:hypothetical protein